MNKGIKKILCYAIFILIGFLGYTLYRKIKAMIELSKTLPQYLKNILGEKPKIDFNLNLQKTNIKIHLSKKTLDKNPDLEQTVRDYINDFYPALCKKRIEIELIAGKQKVQEEKEETKK